MKEYDAFGIKETIEASTTMINSLSTTYDFTRVSMVLCIQLLGIWAHGNYQGRILEPSPKGTIYSYRDESSALRNHTWPLEGIIFL